VLHVFATLPRRFPVYKAVRSAFKPNANDYDHSLGDTWSLTGSQILKDARTHGANYVVRGIINATDVNLAESVSLYCTNAALRNVRYDAVVRMGVIPRNVEMLSLKEFAARRVSGTVEEEDF
jgi:hypothetical protein